jgi:hypothetical protein
MKWPSKVATLGIRGYQITISPILSREAIVVIADQIQKVLDKKKIIKAICSIDVRGYDYVASEFEEGRYSLADILFRHAYASSRIKPLPVCESARHAC